MKLRIPLAILTLCLTALACIMPAAQLLENIEQLETPTCITTRSDEDTETIQAKMRRCVLNDLHHHPIR